jgi:cobalamin biosynthesis protein CbiG
VWKGCRRGSSSVRDSSSVEAVPEGKELYGGDAGGEAVVWRGCRKGSNSVRDSSSVEAVPEGKE